nr:uncharacterized protein LOC116424704 [Nomia melanderi]
MTVRKEERKIMRHSSSWPDRTPQTVKVRVDPLSRAFTIIPTIREGFHPLLAAVEPGWIDEIVLLDRGPAASAEFKHRFLDGAEVGEPDRRGKFEETYELDAFVPEIMNSGSNRDQRIAARLSGSFLFDQSATDPLRSTQDAEKLEGIKSNDSVIDEESRSSWLEDKNDPSVGIKNSLTKEDGSDDSKEDIKSNEDSLPLETIVQIQATCQDSTEENPANSDEDSEAGKSPNSQDLDYDYPGSSREASQRPRHVCPKCTSVGLLKRFDPFGSSNDNSNLVREGRCQVAGSGKAETLRKYSTVEKKMRNSWQRIGATGLIGATRNRNKEKANCGEGRNGEPLCRSTNDVRKEATLRRHYYPEGGWGYVIVTCSALVHFLGIGLQLAAPGSWHLTAELKFHQPPLHSAGKARSRHLPYN